MEADSTTYDNNHKDFREEPCLPFTCHPGNFKFYSNLVSNSGEKSHEWQIIEKAQMLKLIPESMPCPMDIGNCKVSVKPARVVDRVQWVCESCGRRQPIRAGSFFLRLQCSILQTLQIILAWCEDADSGVAAEYFGVKPKTASIIYDRLEDLAINALKKTHLGGENSIVFAEMYPDCLNRLSPDTTDQPHVHRILMLADTNHIPTFYRLHVIKEDSRRGNIIMNENLIIKNQLEDIISEVVLPNSTLITANSLPLIDGALSNQQLLQHCNGDTQHFLNWRIWRQALSLCAASRDLCAGASASHQACANAVQRYLDTALYRIRFGDGFYSHMLSLVADKYTETNVTCNPNDTTETLVGHLP